MPKTTNISFENTRCVITYDLENNDVSTEDIAGESHYLNCTTAVNNTSYDLPYTTLRSDLDVEKAKDEFKRALRATGSRSNLKRLFIVDAQKNSGYIENN